ncbi:MAG: Protein translocase subunit SecY, partial [uncultured Quadrisphaera sp.]
ARSVRVGVQDARPAAQDPVHAGDHGRVPARVVHPDARRELRQRAGVPRRPRPAVRPARPGQPLQRRRAAAAVGVRARDHALHHGQHHRAAAAGGHPPLRGAAPGGAERHRQAHPVHALPDHRARGAAVDDLRRRRPQRQPLRLRRHRPRGVPERGAERLRRHPRAHGADDDGRHRPGDVARRAHHRARHRQRHVAADLHLDRRHLPHLAALRGPRAGLGHDGPGHPRRSGDHGAGRARRAVAAAGARAVRQADGGAPDVRRHQHLHPDEGQHGRRHPGHLRLLAALPAQPGGPVRRPHRRVGGVDRDELHHGRAPGLHGALLPPDRVLHVLLRGHHVQPGGGGRQHEARRRLHPRRARRPAHRRVPRLRADPHHAARRPVPGPGLAGAADRAGRRGRQPEHPPGRHGDPHRRRRRPGDRQADRVAAAAAQLRGLPAM